MIRRYTEFNAAGDVIASGSSVVVGLGADRLTLPADGSAAALCHFAQAEAGDAAWSINGQPYTEPLQQDADSGLWWSEIEVDAVGRTAGDLVIVTCNGGEPVTLEVV